MAVKKNQKIEGMAPKGTIPGMGKLSDIPVNETLRASNADPNVPRKVVDPNAVIIRRLNK